jgi:hypothetical protein
MKKVMQAIFVTVLICIQASAQDTAKDKSNFSVLSVSAGAGFPVGNFASKDMNNPNAGLALTGFSIHADYCYHFSRNYGFAGQAFYNVFNVDNQSYQHLLPGAQMDHWKAAGIMAGPLLTGHPSNNLALELKLMVGLSEVNSFKLTYDNTVLQDEDWSLTPSWLAGGTIRYALSGKAWLLLNSNFIFLRPEFSPTTMTGETEKSRQNMDYLNITAGIGFKL